MDTFILILYYNNENSIIKLRKRKINQSESATMRIIRDDSSLLRIKFDNKLLDRIDVGYWSPKIVVGSRMKKDSREKGERERKRERRDRYQRPIEVTRLLWFSHYSSGRSILEAHLAAGTISALSLLAASSASSLWSFVLFFLRHSFLTRILIPHTKIPYVAVYVELLLSCCFIGYVFRSVPLPPPDFRLENYISLRRLNRLTAAEPLPLINPSIPTIICPLCTLPPVSTWSWMITVFPCNVGFA